MIGLLNLVVFTWIRWAASNAIIRAAHAEQRYADAEKTYATAHDVRGGVPLKGIEAHREQSRLNALAQESAAAFDEFKNAEERAERAKARLHKVETRRTPYLVSKFEAAVSLLAVEIASGGWVSKVLVMAANWVLIHSRGMPAA